MLSTIINEIALKPRLHFLTLKGKTERQQKIGYVNDMLRKISSHYYIVRESNIQSQGYHFHAIFSLDRDIKPTWYRKGVHIQVVPLGDVKKRDPDFPTSLDEVLHIAEEERERVKDMTSDDLIVDDVSRKVVIARQSHRAKMKKVGHVTRVIVYMNKEGDKTLQYTDYIYHKPNPNRSGLKTPAP